jgi:hypothetical protein
MTTLSSVGIYSQGYMFVPYIMSQTLSVIIDRRYEIVLRRQKIEKLNKLNSL